MIRLYLYLTSNISPIITIGCGVSYNVFSHNHFPVVETAFMRQTDLMLVI